MEDWSKLTVNQLKAECTSRSLDTTGKKADLVQRLEEHTAAENEQNEEEVEQVEEAEEAEEQTEEAEEQAEVAEGDENGDVAEGDQEAEGEEEAQEEIVEEEGGEDEEEATAEEEVEAQEEAQEGGENVDEVIDAIDSYMEDEGEGDKKEDEKTEDKEKSEEKPSLKKATSRPKVPIKKVVRAEFQEEQRVRTVVFGPLVLPDLKNEEMLEFLSQADQFFIRFATDGSTGHAQLRMKTFEDAQSLVESMTENPFKEGLVIKQLGPEDGQNVDAILKGETEKAQEKFDVRMLYVHNVPESATEDALRQLLPEAQSACIPRDEKRKSKGYAYLEFEDSEKMEACYKSVATLTLDGFLMTLHHIPTNVYEQQQKYSPGRPQVNRSSNFSGNRGGRRPDQRGSYQQRDRRQDRNQGGRQGYSGGGNRNWGGNVRPLLGNQPSNWGNQGNQGGSGGVDAVNLLVGLSQMLSNQQQGGQSSQSFSSGGNQGFRQGNYGGRQGGSQDQWNRKRRANDGGGIGYGKMQRNDNYGGGYNQGGYKGGRRY